MTQNSPIPRSNIRLLYRLIVTDKKGKIIKRTHWRRSQSFVLQYLQFLDIQLSHAYGVGGNVLTVKDTSGANRSMGYSGGGNWIYTWCIWAPDNIATYGIVVGTGTNAPTNSDYALQTQIAHGTGAGQLDYGAHSRTAPAVVGSNVDYIISRSFYNGSGATITVNEIGVYCTSIDPGFVNIYFFCLIRDKLAAGQDVADKQTLTVQYTLRTTV